MQTPVYSSQMLDAHSLSSAHGPPVAVRQALETGSQKALQQSLLSRQWANSARQTPAHVPV
jgi:hypothetical protein